MVGFSGVRWGREGGGRRRGAKRKVGSEGELLLVILISVEAFEVGLRGGGGGRSGASGGDREVVKEEREEREKGDEAKMSVAASWDEKGEWGRNHHQRGGLSPELRHHHLVSNRVGFHFPPLVTLTNYSLFSVIDSIQYIYIQ